MFGQQYLAKEWTDYSRQNRRCLVEFLLSLAVDSDATYAELAGVVYQAEAGKCTTQSPVAGREEFAVIHQHCHFAIVTPLPAEGMNFIIQHRHVFVYLNDSIAAGIEPVQFNHWLGTAAVDQLVTSVTPFALIRAEAKDRIAATAER